MLITLMYVLYLAREEEPLERQNDANNKTEFVINILAPGERYRWYAQVTDEDGATNVGDIYSFTVE